MVYKLCMVWCIIVHEAFYDTCAIKIILNLCLRCECMKCAIASDNANWAYVQLRVTVQIGHICATTLNLYLNMECMKKYAIANDNANCTWTLYILPENKKVNLQYI